MHTAYTALFIVCFYHTQVFALRNSKHMLQLTSFLCKFTKWVSLKCGTSAFACVFTTQQKNKIQI
jgi:hypothetical protein